MKLRYRAAFWAVSAIAGAIQAWQYRFYIEPDGLNYLDIASAYLRHDWPMAVNSYWSPLYSWLLAGMLYVFHPSPYWESTALHALNFVIFLAALRSGEFLIQELMPLVKLPPWAFWTIGYCLLLSTSLFMVPVSLDTPDLLVAALVYPAAGLLLRIRSGRTELRTYVLFGVVLAVAYLAKTVMFPVALAFLIAAAWRRPRAAVALACFAAVSLPWIAVLSHSVGRITYGDAGTANYAEYVDHSGAPIHPPLTFGVVREFGSPIRATYPLWFNPPYWSEGIRPRIRLGTQLAALLTTGKQYLHILSGQREFILAWIVLLLAGGGFPLRWPILLPALSALGLYALVGHVEPRLVGAFLAVLWLTLFAAVDVTRPRLLLCVTLALAAITVFKVGKAEILAPRAVNVQWETANAMHLQPGTRVAYFGQTKEADYWARLAGVEIAADIPEEAMPEYRSASPEVRREIREQLSLLGIQTVVVEGPTSRGVLASALP